MGDKPNDKLTDEQIAEYILDMPDDVVKRLALGRPWQYDIDEDGFKQTSGFPVTGDKTYPTYTREQLQEACWQAATEDPMISTAMRGLTGRMTGEGFEVSSSIHKIQTVIDEIELDPRNRLWDMYPKFAFRSNAEGELFLILTLHTNGFVEVDFLPPTYIKGQSSKSNGIIFHPTKTTMPLVYLIKDDEGQTSQYPSIFVAHYPELLKEASKHEEYDQEKLNEHRNMDSEKLKKTWGYFRFVVSWDRTWITERNVPFLQTILKWLNLYKNLKEWEADYKKSAASYLWSFAFNDPVLWKQWLALSDEDKAKTGIAAKKTPGSSVVTPPGLDLKAVHPNLPKISDEDRDVLRLVTAGLNEPEDVSTGEARGTYASLRMSRGPFSERRGDEVASWDRFLRYGLWGNIFFLRSTVTEFPRRFIVKECVGFDYKGDKDPEPILKEVHRLAEQLIEISIPSSEISDLDGRAKAMLGTKHGGVANMLGIPYGYAARMLGIKNYNQLRRQRATEDATMPKVEPPVDWESVQEQGLEGDNAVLPKKKAKPKAALKPKPKES